MKSWIKCDETGCDWQINIDPNEVPEWHNKTCPTCNEGIIINDDDMVAWNSMMAIVHFNAAIDPDEKLDRVTCVVDTAVLRNKE